MPSQIIRKQSVARRGLNLLAAAGGGAPPANITPPSIDNLSPKVGDTLTRTAGAWSGTPSITGQWKRGGVAIMGETGTTYVVAVADIGAVITYTETDSVSSTSATSDPTATILSNDTSFSVFRVDATDVTDDSTLNYPPGTMSVGITATPNSGAASRTINGDAAADPVTVGSLASGDNDVDVLVTAEDGTQAHHHVNVHVLLTVAQPEITTIDFSGKSGADFVTVGTGKSFALSCQTSIGEQSVSVWFNTGTETAPGVLPELMVSVSAADNGNTLASELASLLDGAVVDGVDPWTTNTSGPVCTVTDNSSEPRTDAADVDSGLIITVTQQGQIES